MKKAGERMKPRIFIGSSKESVKIAEKVKSLLDGEYVCQLWCDNFFDLGQCTYHELLKKSLSFDYAIFIGGKDDYVRRESDRTHKYAARDNVYLEFGLYAGILTYARCFSHHTFFRQYKLHPISVLLEIPASENFQNIQLPS